MEITSRVVLFVLICCWSSSNHHNLSIAVMWARSFSAIPRHIHRIRSGPSHTTTATSTSFGRCSGGASCSSAHDFSPRQPGCRSIVSSTRQQVAHRYSTVQDFFHGDGKDPQQTTNTNTTTTTLVTYITDVEGDKAYLERYVATSKVLTFQDSSVADEDDDDDDDDGSIPSSSSSFPYSQRIDFTDPRAMLVFGGDAWDKGGHDLYTIRQLLDLKRRYPDRVVFILGNRDVNKLRILQEIGLQEPAPYHPGLMWFKGSGRVGDPESNPPPSDSAERLRWMFANTMGSPDAFEHRRRELQWERSSSSEFCFLQENNNNGNTSASSMATTTVTDQEVVDSYRSSCHPKGELGQFLSQAQLICRLGPLLFVHGSLPLISEHVEEIMAHCEDGGSVWDDLTFCMPWLPEGETAKDHGVTTIDQWMTAMNEFCHVKVEEWQADIARIEALGGVDNSKQPIWAREAGYHYGPSYSDLIQYGMGMLPNRKKNPSVIYNSFTPSGMPNRFYPDSDEPHMVQATKEFFDRAAIQVILAGHKPQGDMPSPIRVDDSAWVLLGDTSYSGETIWHHHHDDDKNDLDNELMGNRPTNLGRGNSVSFRGEVAVSEILLELKGEELESVAYHGVLSDGSEYETVNLLTHGKNTTIGQVAPEHLVPSEVDSPHQGRWWTKSIFSDGSHLYHAGKDFNIWNWKGKPLKSPSTK